VILDKDQLCYKLSSPCGLSARRTSADGRPGAASVSKTGDPTFLPSVTRSFCPPDGPPDPGQPQPAELPVCRKEGQGELRRKKRLHAPFPPLRAFRHFTTPLSSGRLAHENGDQPHANVRGSWFAQRVAILAPLGPPAPSESRANVRSSGTLRQCDLPCTSATRQAPLPSESGHRWTSHSSGTSHPGNKAFHAYQTRPYVCGISRSL
jgi:hypothetical protein